MGRLFIAGNLHFYYCGRRGALFEKHHTAEISITRDCEIRLVQSMLMSGRYADRVARGVLGWLRDVHQHDR